jgi:hypothetical protein
MLSYMRPAAATLMLVFGAIGCGDAEIGDECDRPGQRDDCEDGALCTNEGRGPICRALCAEQGDCPPGHGCNGVSGTNQKTCQPE